MRIIYATVTTLQGTVLVNKVAREVKEDESIIENCLQLAKDIANEYDLSHEKVLVKYYDRFEDIVPVMLPIGVKNN
jgi:predicted GNAT family N-acyltransferase